MALPTKVWFAWRIEKIIFSYSGDTGLFIHSLLSYPQCNCETIQVVLAQCVAENLWLLWADSISRLASSQVIAPLILFAKSS